MSRGVKALASSAFTLLELMMVVAIVGVLSVIAMPAYKHYIAKSQTSAALLEIRGGVSGFESAVARNVIPSLDTGSDGYIGISTESSYCVVSLEPPSAPNKIVCTARPETVFAGETIAVERSDGGSWQCRVSTSLESRYRPEKCID